MFAKIKIKNCFNSVGRCFNYNVSAVDESGDDISAAKTTGGKAADVVAGVSVIASVIALAPVLVPLGALLYAVMYFRGGLLIL